MCTITNSYMLWHVPAFGRFALSLITFGSVIILSLRWGLPASKTKCKCYFAHVWFFFRRSHRRLLFCDRKPNSLTRFTLDPVASVLSHSDGVAQIRKLLQLVHRTDKSLRFVASHSVNLFLVSQLKYCASAHMACSYRTAGIATPAFVHLR